MSHNRRLDKLEHDEPTEPTAPTPAEIAASHMSTTELQALVKVRRMMDAPWSPEKDQAERDAEGAEQRFDELRARAERGELAMNPNR